MTFSFREAVALTLINVRVDGSVLKHRHQVYWLNKAGVFFFFFTAFLRPPTPNSTRNHFSCRCWSRHNNRMEMSDFSSPKNRTFRRDRISVHRPGNVGGVTLEGNDPITSDGVSGSRRSLGRTLSILRPCYSSHATQWWQLGENAQHRNLRLSK